MTIRRVLKYVFIFLSSSFIIISFLVCKPISNLKSCISYILSGSFVQVSHIQNIRSCIELGYKMSLIEIENWTILQTKKKYLSNNGTIINNNQSTFEIGYVGSTRKRTSIRSSKRLQCPFACGENSATQSNN